MNTDGSAKGNHGQAGIGGVLRHESSTWIWGFYGRLQDSTSLEFELWGIFKGLKFVLEQGLNNIT